MEYTKENPLRVFTAFSGYDSQCLALNRLGIDYYLVGWSEIDKYAIQAHNALFPDAKDKNYGDISKIDWNEVADFDLFTMSSPCQDFSSAGLQKGGAEGSGTRSSLLWECRRAILAKKPKYILFENVKALVSQKFLPYFLKWQNELASYGYSNFAKVLNARDFGIPQNRERIFMVSILDENASYHFPEPFPLDKRLKDVLEEEVDEKYYLSKKLVDYVFSNGGKNGNIKGAIGVHEKEDDISNTITAQYWKTPRQGNYIKEPIACAMRGREVQCLTPKRTEYGKKVRKEYESGDLKESRHNMQRLEPRNDGVCNTITSVQKDNLLIEPRVHQVGNIANGNSFDNPQRGRVYSPNGISPTIDTMAGGNREPKILDESNDYRIRKLTERECFRLQDVDDADIDKIQAVGISRSQQYKLAGNSICVGVLFHIFRKLFIDTENENKQLTLF